MLKVSVKKESSNIYRIDVIGSDIHSRACVSADYINVVSDGSTPVADKLFIKAQDLLRLGANEEIIKGFLSMAMRSFRTLLKGDDASLGEYKMAKKFQRDIKLYSYAMLELRDPAKELVCEATKPYIASPSWANLKRAALIF